MLGSHTDELVLLVQGANQWRQAARDLANLELTQVNVLMPDGKPLALVWNPTAHPPTGSSVDYTGDWDVRPA